MDLERGEVELYTPLRALVAALTFQLGDPVCHRLHYLIALDPEVRLYHLQNKPNLLYLHTIIRLQHM